MIISLAISENEEGKKTHWLKYGNKNRRNEVILLNNWCNNLTSSETSDNIHTSCQLLHINQMHWSTCLCGVCACAFERMGVTIVEKQKSWIDKIKKNSLYHCVKRPTLNKYWKKKKKRKEKKCYFSMQRLDKWCTLLYSRPHTFFCC